MLKYFVLALLAASPALAQQAPNPAAIGNVLISCVGREVQAADRIAQLEAELAKLKAPPPAHDEKPK